MSLTLIQASRESRLCMGLLLQNVAPCFLPIAASLARTDLVLPV